MSLNPWFAGNRFQDILRTRLLRLISCLSFAGNFPNVWLCISAENQSLFTKRWRDSPKDSGAKRFISFEPILGPIEVQAELLRLKSVETIYGWIRSGRIKYVPPALPRPAAQNEP